MIEGTLQLWRVRRVRSWDTVVLAVDEHVALLAADRDDPDGDGGVETRNEGISIVRSTSDLPSTWAPSSVPFADTRGVEPEDLLPGHDHTCAEWLDWIAGAEER